MVNTGKLDGLKVLVLVSADELKRIQRPVSKLTDKQALLRLHLLKQSAK